MIGMLEAARARKAPRITALLMAGLLGSTSMAHANDNGGVFSFFQQAFGGGNGGTYQALPQPDYAEPSSPPLTVRIHPRRHRVTIAARSPKDTVADLKGITIYTDKTLERGDVVMTTRGMRVFNGSRSWPYTDQDFVALASARQMRPEISKELHLMDIASRIDAAY